MSLSLKEKRIVRKASKKYNLVLLTTFLKTHYPNIYTKFIQFENKNRLIYKNPRQRFYHFLGGKTKHCLYCNNSTPWRHKGYAEYCCTAHSNLHKADLLYYYESTHYSTLTPKDRRELIYLLRDIKDKYSRYLELPLLRYLDTYDPRLAKKVVNLPAVNHGSRLKIIFNEIKPQACLECGGVIVYSEGALRKETCSVLCSGRRNSRSAESKAKRKQTCLERYGVEYAIGSRHAREKSKKTCLERYGVAHPMNLKSNKDKLKQTNLRRRGFEHAFQDPAIQSKIKQTCLERYGVENANQSPRIRAKSKATCLERYGVENIAQDPMFQEAQLASRFRRKEYKLGNKKIFIQGYEPQALDFLLLHFKPKDIVHGASKVPSIPYLYKDKRKVYFPDFYIPGQNLIIEVKSKWTFIRDREMFLLTRQKAKATISEGYSYRLLLMLERGGRVELPSDWVYKSYKSILKIVKSAKIFKVCTTRASKTYL